MYMHYYSVMAFILLPIANAFVKFLSSFNCLQKEGEYKISKSSEINTPSRMLSISQFCL